jgi:hypothetical protein
MTAPAEITFKDPFGVSIALQPAAKVARMFVYPIDSVEDDCFHHLQRPVRSLNSWPARPLRIGISAGET